MIIRSDEWMIWYLEGWRSGSGSGSDREEGYGMGWEEVGEDVQVGP